MRSGTPGPTTVGMSSRRGPRPRGRTGGLRGAGLGPSARGASVRGLSPPAVSGWPASGRGATGTAVPALAATGGAGSRCSGAVSGAAGAGLAVGAGRGSTGLTAGVARGAAGAELSPPPSARRRAPPHRRISGPPRPQAPPAWPEVLPRSKASPAGVSGAAGFSPGASTATGRSLVIWAAAGFSPERARESAAAGDWPGGSATSGCSARAGAGGVGMTAGLCREVIGREAAMKIRATSDSSTLEEALFTSKPPARNLSSSSWLERPSFLRDVVDTSFRHKPPVLFAHSPAAAARISALMRSSSTTTVARKARWNALRCRARSRHDCCLHRYAPRPLSPRPVVTTIRSDPSRSSTHRRRRLPCGPRLPHPMHWRSGFAATNGLVRGYPAV